MESGTPSRTNMVFSYTGAVVLHYCIIVGSALLPIRRSQNYVHLTGTWVDHILQWDGVWYTSIGRYGYHISMAGQVLLARLGNHLPISPVKATAFFPLIPMLVHSLGVFGTLAMTNMLFVMSVPLFAAWLEKHGLSTTWGVLLFTLNPAAMFLSFLYPASYLVFFTLCVIRLTETRTRWWWMAAVFGYLSSLTTGLGSIVGIFSLGFWVRREWAKGLIYGLSVAMGWVTFALILRGQGLQPLSFLKAQQIWGRVWKLPLMAWFKAFGKHSSIEHFDQVYVAIFIGLLVLYAMKWLRTKHIPISTFAWSIVYILFCLSSYWLPYALIGTLRFMSLAFPLYGALSNHSTTSMKWLISVILVTFIFAFTVGSIKVSHAFVYQ